MSCGGYGCPKHRRWSAFIVLLATYHKLCLFSFLSCSGSVTEQKLTRQITLLSKT